MNVSALDQIRKAYKPKLPPALAKGLRRVRVQAVAPEGRNHNKFAVIDQDKVITGSYNWTLKAEKNWENLLILDCPELAKLYVREWEAIQ